MSPIFLGFKLFVVCLVCRYFPVFINVSRKLLIQQVGETGHIRNEMACYLAISADSLVDSPQPSVLTEPHLPQHCLCTRVDRLRCHQLDDRDTVLQEDAAVLSNIKVNEN